MDTEMKFSLYLLVFATFFAYSTTQERERVYFPSEALPVANRGTDFPEGFSTNTGYENYVNDIISNGISKLTLSVDKFLVQRSTKNIVFSPISITAALALVLLGSNGKTFKEIVEVMGLTAGVSDIESRSQVIHEQFGRMVAKLQRSSGFEIGTQVVFGSAVFVQNDFPIRSIYKQTAEELYSSEILNVDFQNNPSRTQKIINAWVSDRTNGKIKQILDESPAAETKIIIATAMYFKAEWENQFFEGTTQKRSFYGNGRMAPPTVQVDMMSNGGFFPYFKDQTLGCEILGFPYKGNRSTMYVVMPFNSNPDRLKQLVEGMTFGDFSRLVGNAKYTSAVVLFPKMRIESTVELKEPLRALGVSSLFDPSNANLALLSPGTQATTPLVARINPLAASDELSDDKLYIFAKSGEKVDCSQIVDANGNATICRQIVEKGSGNAKTKISLRANNPRVAELNQNTVDHIRQLINQQNPSNNYQNPGLYADKIIHKVYMDITETGTEAAAATSVSLSRDGSKVTYRVDAPFFFFIWHEETKVVTFWGSVNTPTPNYAF